MKHKFYFLVIAILLLIIGILVGIVVTTYLEPNPLFNRVEVTLQGSGTLVKNVKSTESNYDQSEVFSPDEKAKYEVQGYLVNKVVSDSENTIQLETGPLYLSLDQIETDIEGYHAEAETYMRSVGPLSVTFSLCGKEGARTCDIVLSHIVTGDTIPAQVIFDEKSGKITVKASKKSGLVTGTYRTKPVEIDIAPR